MIDLERLWNVRLNGWAWQVKKEFLDLLRLMQELKIRNVLEIGCWDGGSAAGFLHIGCTVASIDIAKRERVSSLEKQFPDTFAFQLRKTLCGLEWPNTHDMLYLDGEHSYEAVKKDYEEFKHLVKPGGIIVFHDILKNELHAKQGCEVWKFWEEVRGEKYKEIITDGTWGGIGVMFV